MGSSPSVQAPPCSCSPGTDSLPYSVFDAARNGHLTTVNEYLKEHGDVNATYKGETMLHVACLHGRENVLSLLLNQKKLCVNLRDSYNETALMKAARSGYKDSVEILLVYKHRCPLEIYCKNNDEVTAVDIAHIKNHQEVAYCMTSFIKNCPPPAEQKPRQKPWGDVFLTSGKPDPHRQHTEKK